MKDVMLNHYYNPCNGSEYHFIDQISFKLEQPKNKIQVLNIINRLIHSGS